MIGNVDMWIRRNLGMDKDELLRLKQVSGLAKLFADKEFEWMWNKQSYTEYWKCVALKNIEGDKRL